MWHRKISNFPLDCHTSEIHGNVLPLMGILQENFGWGHGTERCECGGWPGLESDIHTQQLVKFPPLLICCQLSGSSCEHRGRTSWVMWRSARFSGLITLCMCESGILLWVPALTHSLLKEQIQHCQGTEASLLHSSSAPRNRKGRGCPEHLMEQRYGWRRAGPTPLAPQMQPVYCLRGGEH